MKDEKSGEIHSGKVPIPIQTISSPHELDHSVDPLLAAFKASLWAAENHDMTDHPLSVHILSVRQTVNEVNEEMQKTN